MPVAALTATVVAGPGVVGRLTPERFLVGIGLAILLPVVPFTLELLAALCEALDVPLSGVLREVSDYVEAEELALRVVTAPTLPGDVVASAA